MSGPRLALAVPGAPASTVLAAARAAEAANLDALVIGDPGGTAHNSDDSYVLTTAGAVAVATTDLRLCLALSLRGSAPPLRIAEDLGVLDVMSGGRIELLLTPARDDPDDRWRADLDSILGAWAGWPLPDGNTAPVTPRPVQPVLPAWLLDGDTASCLRGGPGAVLIDRPGALPDLDTLLEIRRLRDHARADTVIVRAGEASVEDLLAVVRALGTVVGPCLRCPPDDVAIMATDTTEWLLHRTELHEPPPR